MIYVLSAFIVHMFLEQFFPLGYTCVCMYTAAYVSAVGDWYNGNSYRIYFSKRKLLSILRCGIECGIFFMVWCATRNCTLWDTKWNSFFRGMCETTRKSFFPQSDINTFNREQFSAVLDNTPKIISRFLIHHVIIPQCY